MNYLRTTERSLHSLKLGGSKISLKRGSGSQIGRSSAFNLKTTKRGFASRPSIFRGAQSIKFCNNVIIKPPLRELSSVANIPLLNPNKLAPDHVAEPPSGKTTIRPLTQPIFSRSKPASEIPSVTKVLQATMPASSRFILDKWKESMILKLGIQGFQQYQKDTFERGHALHHILANYLLGRGEPLEGSADLNSDIKNNLWKSIQNVVRDKISSVRLVEHIVTHTDLNYRGIVDCVAVYENELVVIDFKTAEKTKKTIESLYDNPLQVTAYCGAINNDKSLPSHVIDRNICSGLVIVAYTDGSEASTYYLSKEEVINNYWKQWTSRLDQFSRMEEMNKKLEGNNSKTINTTFK